MLPSMERLIIDAAAAIGDVDIDATGRWVALARRGPAPELLFDSGRRIPLPRACRFPLVRLLTPGVAALVDARVSGGEINAWVLDESGFVHAAFHAGDAVEDLIARDDGLVVTYFDEAFGGALSGAAAFDVTGRLRARYGDLRDAATIVDCYAAGVVSGGAVCLLAYPDFPLIRWWPEEERHECFVVPEVLHGAAALSAAGRALYFHGCYANGAGIFRWRPGDDSPRLVGSHTGRLRGLAGGRFVEVVAGGCTVVVPETAEHDLAAI